MMVGAQVGLIVTGKANYTVRPRRVVIGCVVLTDKRENRERERERKAWPSAHGVSFIRSILVSPH